MLRYSFALRIHSESIGLLPYPKTAAVTEPKRYKCVNTRNQHKHPVDANGHLKPPPPARRPRSLLLVSRRSAQTTIVNHCVVGQDSDDTSTPHTAAELLVADHAVPLLGNSNMPVAAALAAGHVVSQVQS